MKILALFVAFILVSLLPPGASAQKVETRAFQDIPKGTSTFHWHKGFVLTKAGQTEDPAVDTMVHNAVAKEMTARGFTESTGKDGLELSYMGGISADIRTDSIFMGDYMVWGTAGGTTYVDGQVYASGRTYKKSSLIITVVDPVPNKAVWAARATDNFGNPSELEQRINKAVAKSFDKFPVQKK